MKILEVMIALPRGTGTTEFFLESITAMAAAGADVSVLCQDFCGFSFKELKTYSQVEELPREYVPDVVHIHAMWSIFLYKVHLWARKHKIPVIVSPHGSLSPWALRSKWWKKLPYWLLIEKPSLRHAAAFHVTASPEGNWVRRLGFRQPQIQVPLGVHIPVPIPNVPKTDEQGCRMILSLGRLYQVKALDRIAEAIAILKRRGSWCRWKMVMAGPDWRGYRRELEAKIDALGLQDDIFLPGPVFGEQKKELFSKASIYITASYTENFCQPVAEALTYRVPVIASRGCPWADLEKWQCGLWVENDPDSLSAALEKLMVLSDEERVRLGDSGRRWMQRDFGWDAVGLALVNEFSKLIEIA